MRLDGNTPVGNRQNMINTFNKSDSDINLFLISLYAGSLGINLISASRVIVFDVGWNPLFDEQAIARVYRFWTETACIRLQNDDGEDFGGEDVTKQSPQSWSFEANS